MSALITARRTMGCKIESTPYTAESLAVTDFNVPAYNINYDVDIPIKDRLLARGDWSHDIGVAGKRKFSCSFSVDLQYSGTANTAPTYGKCLQACAMKGAAQSTVGYAFWPNADYSNVPLTIEIVEKDEGASPVQLVIKASGCMGNVKIVANAVGEPVRLDFDFQGALVSITDRAFANILTPTGFNTILPEAILAATITAFGEAQVLGGYTIDLQNDVQMFSDPSKSGGYQGAHVVNADPILDIDPDMELVANRNQIGRLLANTTGAVSFQTNNFTISAPQAQIIQGYKPGDREGHVVNNIRFRLTRDTNGNDCLRLLQKVAV